MIGWRGYILWGVLVYLWFLAISLPVGWLYAHLAHYVPYIQGTQLRGTPWSGQAERISVGSMTFGPLQWQFLWRTLWTGRPSLVLQWHEGSGVSGRVVVGVEGTVDLSRKLLFLEQGDLEISVPWLQTQHAFLPPGSSGQVRLILDSLVVDVDQQHVKRLQGIATLSNMWVGSPVHLSLGDFQWNIQLGEEGGVHVAVQDLQAPLRVKATVQWHMDGHYRIRGTLAARDATDERMMTLLRLVGQPGPQGRVGLDLSGLLTF